MPVTRFSVAFGLFMGLDKLQKYGQLPAFSSNSVTLSINPPYYYLRKHFSTSLYYFYIPVSKLSFMNSV